MSALIGHISWVIITDLLTHPHGIAEVLNPTGSKCMCFELRQNMVVVSVLQDGISFTSMKPQWRTDTTHLYAQNRNWKTINQLRQFLLYMMNIKFWLNSVSSIEYVMQKQFTEMFVLKEILKQVRLWICAINSKHVLISRVCDSFRIVQLFQVARDFDTTSFVYFIFLSRMQNVVISSSVAHL